jgi:mxaJ protein
MSKSTRKRRQTVALLWIAAILAGGAGIASAAPDTAKAAEPSMLRICAAANEEPYSKQDGSGFENKIAEIVAKAMDRKPDFVWSDKPAIYLVRDQLDKNTCDIVIGLDTGDERVLTSKPYYRAPYVFVLPKDSKLDIKDWDSPDLDKANKIGFAQDGPAQVMLEKRGLFNRNFNYMKSLIGFKSKRNQYVRVPPERLVGDVAAGTSDLAVGFAPEIARYVKQHGDKLKMVVIPDNATRSDGQRVPLHFDQSLGVRKQDAELLSQVNAAIEKVHPQIEQILKDEGIPLDESKSTDGRAG